MSNSIYSLSSITNLETSINKNSLKNGNSCEIRKRSFGQTASIRRIGLNETNLKFKNDLFSSHNLLNVKNQNEKISQNEDNLPLTLSSAKEFSISLPLFPISRSIADLSFEEVCSDPSIVLSPRKLGFIPSSTWPNDSISFGILIATFFRRRNSSNSKFPYKLYNSLRISELCPEFYPHIGIKWVNEDTLWIDREPFARLIGVKTVEGGLFHQQGNFPSHGFIELSFEESEALSKQLGLGKINLSKMRLVRHINGLFTRYCTENDIEFCKWKGN